MNVIGCDEVFITAEEGWYVYHLRTLMSNDTAGYAITV